MSVAFTPSANLSFDTSGTNVPTYTSSQLSQADATQQLVNQGDLGSQSASSTFDSELGHYEAVADEERAKMFKLMEVKTVKEGEKNIPAQGGPA